MNQLTETHKKRIEQARALLQVLQQRLDDEAAMTSYDWGHVGSLGHLVEHLRQLGPYWMGEHGKEQ